MGLQKYESEVKFIPQDVNTVYERFADLRNLAALKEKLSDPAVREKMAEQVPADKMAEAEKQMENMQFDQDSVSLASPVGNITLAVVERDAPKLIKFEGQGTPIPLYLWLQLLPVSTYECKLRVTIGAELNIFMKGMISKPLQQAAEGLANILAAVR